MTDKELIAFLRKNTIVLGDQITIYDSIKTAAADRLEALLAENEHLREITKMAPQWVSVKDQLPGNDGRYLCVKRIREDGPIYVTILNWDCDGFYWEYTYCNDVTHWMCLPTPPRTEGVK